MTSTSNPDPHFFLLLALALLIPAISDPHPLGTISSTTYDPVMDTLLSQIIASNPSLSSMGPQVREMMRSPMMRQMMYVVYGIRIAHMSPTC
jgi:hypothetical protein